MGTPCARRPSAPPRTARLARRRAVQATAKGQVPVLVNSCAGKMGHAVAEAVVESGNLLLPYSVAGADAADDIVNCAGVPIQLVAPEEARGLTKRLMEENPGLIAVDYTVPACVNANAELYCDLGLPFVMGTTGGDRAALVETVRASKNPAVIAPQMGKQVVAMQAMLRRTAEQFPGAFDGYTLTVVESHQQTKLDTSGTAKAIVESFRALGVKAFADDDIERVRNPNESVDRMGVPEDFLDGHAYHTYRLVSPDGTVAFEWRHNVNGRAIYAQGTVDAVLFLHNKVYGGGGGGADGGGLYDMIDVLEAGVMR